MEMNNALQMQELLKQEGNITVPRLQQLLQLPYKEARSLMEKLVEQQWVIPPEQGLFYAVCRENMHLRRLDGRKEAEELLQNLNYDCMAILNCLKEKGPQGCSRRELELAVHGRMDAIKACVLLARYKVIHKQAERYVLSLSQETVEVLVEAFGRMMELDEVTDKRKRTAEMERILSLFDKLFYDP